MKRISLLDIDNPEATRHRSDSLAALFIREMETMDARRLRSTLELGANPNGLVGGFQPALWVALQSSNPASLEIAIALMDAGASVESLRLGVHRSALEPCCLFDNAAAPLEKLSAVLSFGAPADFISHNGDTLAHLACGKSPWANHAAPALLESLRLAGTPLSQPNDNGLCALMVAIEGANFPAILYLWDNGQRLSAEQLNWMNKAAISPAPDSSFEQGASFARSLIEREELAVFATPSSKALPTHRSKSLL